MVGFGGWGGCGVDGAAESQVESTIIYTIEAVVLKLTVKASINVSE